METVLALNDGLWFGVMSIGALFGVIVIAIIFGTLKSTLETKQRESTKRELAAYVAEGSISPEDAERILQADMPHWRKGREG